MSRSSAAAANPASDSQPVVHASPRVRSHRRQWTHSNLDGTKMVRLHRSPVAPAAEPQADTEADVTPSADDQEQAVEQAEDPDDAQAPATRTRRPRQATPAKSREQRRLFVAPVPMAIEEEEEDEEEQQAAAAEPEQEQEEEEEQAEAAAAAAADEEEEEEDSESGSESSDSSEEDELGAGADEQDDDGEAAAEEEEDDDEDDDAWVQEMANFAAAELSRRLKTAPGAAAAAASSASAAGAKPRAAAAAAATAAGASRVIPSASKLDSMFTPRKAAPASSAAAAAAIAAAAAVPHGFVRKAGVLLLSDSTLTEATAADSAEHPSAAHAPDLLATLGARSAANPLTSANPLQAAKSSRQSSAPTAGKDWFNLSRPSALTPELKSDLKLLSLRAYMDPKKFYKKESRKKKIVPTFFQVGTVIAGAQDFYSARLTNKQRTNHYADELIDPSKSVGGVKKMKHYLKRKVIEVQTQNQPAPRTHFNKKRKMMEDASKRPGSKKQAFSKKK